MIKYCQIIFLNQEKTMYNCLMTTICARFVQLIFNTTVLCNVLYETSPLSGDKIGGILTMLCISGGALVILVAITLILKTKSKNKNGK